MAYCRFDENSDVYLVREHSGEYCCVGCGFSKPELIDGEFIRGKSQYFNSKQEALKHLKKHLEAGDKVPLFAIERLEIEIKDNIDSLFVNWASEYFRKNKDR